jgi:hypothetical protein
MSNNFFICAVLAAEPSSVALIRGIRAVDRLDMHGLDFVVLSRHDASLSNQWVLHRPN